MNATATLTTKQLATLKGQETKARNAAQKQQEINAAQYDHIDLFAACEKRALILKDNPVQGSQQTEIRATIKTMGNPVTVKNAIARMSETNWENVQRALGHINSDTFVGFEQTKSGVKIAGIIYAMGAGLGMGANMTNKMGEYMRTVCLTALNVSGGASIRTLICALSKSAYKNEVSTMGLLPGFKNINSYTIGTGSSQASQCRQVLNTFGFYVEGTFIKGGKDNTPILSAYGERMLTALCFKGDAVAA